MTTEAVRAAAGRLTEFHGDFAECFGRGETCGHAWVCLRGLLLGEGRKNVERIALRFAVTKDGGRATQNEVLALQHFLTNSPWDHAAVQQRVQERFAEELTPSASRWAIGTVGVVDESGFVKGGPHSVGAKRQYCGRVGKTEMCQVGVYLIGVVPDGHALLDHQLYLPDEWASDKVRRRKTRVPDEVRFRTKPELAGDLIERTQAAGHVRFDWITADELYGDNGAFLDRLEKAGQKYVMEISPQLTFFTQDPATQVPRFSGKGRPPFRPVRDSVRSANQLLEDTPADAWTRLTLREGGKGPLTFEFARVRVWSVRQRQAGPPVWVLFRRSLDDTSDVKFYVSNAPQETPLKVLAEVAGTRWNVEKFFEEGKGEFGMADYEARAWTSWHHHMSLVATAHLFVTLTRRDLKTTIRSRPSRNTDVEPLELSLPQAVNLLRAALDRPVLKINDALHLTEYHMTRNETARNSHRKTWRRKHQRLNL